MRIAALLGVMDEIDLIAASIDHLQNIGVDTIVVTDWGSTDGTLQILQTKARVGEVLLETLDSSVPMDFVSWSQREVSLAKRTGADWVLFLDGDEFWLPATGNLKECAALANTAMDVVSVDRFNVPLRLDGDGPALSTSPDDYERLLLFVRHIPNLDRFMIENPQFPWIRGVPMRKIIARPDALVSIAAGHHSAVTTSSGGQGETVAADLLIAHMPFTTYGRFERKVANIAQTMSVVPDAYANMAGHWWRWVEFSRQGCLAEEFQRQLIDEPSIQAMRASGDILSAQAIFETRNAS